VYLVFVCAHNYIYLSTCSIIIYFTTTEIDLGLFTNSKVCVKLVFDQFLVDSLIGICVGLV